MKVDLGIVNPILSLPVSNPQSVINIPGVAVLDWFPSLGASGLATDPASVVGKEIYSKVRAAFSGSLDADAPDFVVYLTCLDSIFAYIAYLKRLYRILTYWTSENYYLPDGLLRSMGFVSTDIANLRANRMRLWQNINELVLQARKFTCPAKMDLFNRHYWMSDNVYTDAASLNSQFYVFNMCACYQYSTVTSTDGNETQVPGAKLIKMPWFFQKSMGTDPVMTLFNFGLDLINSLVAWDDAYTISGYLSRAYSDTPSFTVDEIPQDSILTPVYNEEVLIQIENSEACPGLFDVVNSATPVLENLAGFTVSQNPLINAVSSTPNYTYIKDANELAEYSGIAFGLYGLKNWLNLRTDVANPALNVIATRLKANLNITKETGSTGNFVINLTVGTEVPVSWRYNRNMGTSGSQSVYQQRIVLDQRTPAANDLLPQTRSLLDYTEMSSFDWSPFAIIMTIDSNSLINFHPVGDIHNITAIGKEDLANLHKICIYSELNAFDY